jgi:hypothetical protein
MRQGGTIHAEKGHLMGNMSGIRRQRPDVREQENKKDPTGFCNNNKFMLDNI